jgi:hypothetical protein
MLKPEFSDARTCRQCGAPAEQFGDHWTNPDGSRHFRATPIRSKRGVFTHICTRNNMESPEGKASDEPRYFYACGALRDIDTARNPHDKMWGRCYVGDEATTLPVPDFDRKMASAGDAW